MMQETRFLDLGDEPGGGDAPLVAISQHLVEHLREIYILCYREATGKNDYGRGAMPQWDGGEDSFGKRHRPIWPKVAAKIIEYGVDPLDFVRAQFWVNGPSTKPPPPTYLLSEEAIARYGAYRRQATNEACQEFDRGLSEVQGEVVLLTGGELRWEYSRALRQVLLRSRTGCSASALFRYCLASSEGLADVCSHFYASALVQYVFRKDVYDAVWGARIPEGLRLEATRLRRRLLGEPH